jgi:hypothetical protein
MWQAGAPAHESCNEATASGDIPDMQSAKRVITLFIPAFFMINQGYPAKRIMLGVRISSLDTPF